MSTPEILHRAIMIQTYTDEELTRGYYLDFAAALIRHRLPHLKELPPTDLFRQGLEAGLKLHHFKRTSGLPRVSKVLGILRGLYPESVLDIGSGRGVFLWPLLDAFPEISIFSIDRREQHVADVHAVHFGGIGNLFGMQMDVTRLGLDSASVDVVTFLEVLEHLEQPQRALAESVRVARRFVVLSVPSKEDDNPEHLQLISRAMLREMLQSVGVEQVRFDAVLNHTIAIATIKSPSDT